MRIEFRMPFLACLAGLAMLLLSAPGAHAGNTVLFSSSKGDLTFPIVPPTATQPGTIDNMILTPPAGRPTIASGACGSAANGTLSTESTNQSGQIQIGVAATTACVVTFAAGTSFSPKSCVIAPMNAGAADSATVGGYVKTSSATGFEIDGIALAGTVWSYHCF